jgi:LacI family transcriptional regulator
MALGVLQAARRLGLQVPQEFGVVGFDDIPESAYFYPPLTTVRQNATALGSRAVDIMCQHIQCRQEDEPISPGIFWVQPRLVARRSSARI